MVEMSKKKDWDGVIKQGTAIRDLYPDYVEEHSVYEVLAQAYLAKGDKPAAIAELERYVKDRRPQSRCPQACWPSCWKKRAARRKPPPCWTA